MQRVLRCIPALSLCLSGADDAAVTAAAVPWPPWHNQIEILKIYLSLSLSLALSTGLSLSLACVHILFMDPDSTSRFMIHRPACTTCST